jgi:hypothetical protein
MYGTQFSKLFKKIIFYHRGNMKNHQAFLTEVTISERVLEAGWVEMGVANVILTGLHEFHPENHVVSHTSHIDVVSVHVDEPDNRIGSWHLQVHLQWGHLADFHRFVADKEWRQL